MTKPHDERFSTPPAFGEVDAKAYPKGMKPGDDGFLEALLADSGIKFVDKAKKA
tara:strand:- start:315 stop:476 length:162 start_codon:yes stop_codon:yes gene_type:complete